MPTINNQYRYISVAEANKQKVAMLTDIQLEINELPEPQQHEYFMNGYYFAKDEVKDLIQQKINALKENTDSNNK